MKKLLYWAAVAAWVISAPAWAADQELIEVEDSLQQDLHTLSVERDDSQKLRHAKDLAGRHRLSSQQVKQIASKLPDDTAKLEFATAAFPRVVDPENFYEVYDAFTSFSKVMRLHDRIQEFKQRPLPPVQLPPQPLDDEAFKRILQSIRDASFDHTRTDLARQIFGSSRKNFLSSQIKQIVAAFDFDPARLEIAKYAFDFTLDKENYFLVNEAFSFESNKQALSRYIQSRPQPRPPPTPLRPPRP